MEGNGRPLNGGPDLAGAERPISDALQHVSKDFAEIREYAGHVVTAKLDGLKLAIRKAAIGAALGLFGLIAAGAFVVTAVVLLLEGISGALTDWFDSPLWVGNLVAGALVLALVGLATFLAYRRIVSTSRRKTIHKHEERHSEQRRRFGHDVREAAAIRRAT